MDLEETENCCLWEKEDLYKVKSKWIYSKQDFKFHLEIETLNFIKCFLHRWHFNWELGNRSLQAEHAQIQETTSPVCTGYTLTCLYSYILYILTFWLISVSTTLYPMYDPSLANNSTLLSTAFYLLRFTQIANSYNLPFRSFHHGLQFPIEHLQGH